jgi:indolepyruvate ferredoxin oxidoreductase, beta subunit
MDAREAEEDDVSVNIVAAGVGGQGIVFFSQILAKSLIREHIPASFYVHAGLSQLGGSVRSHIRAGGKVCPKIPHGAADLVVALEMAEVYHALSYLARGGKALVSEDTHIPYHSRLRPESYPVREAIGESIARGGGDAVFIPAGRIAREVGSVLTLNMVMLGALIAQTRLVDAESVVLTIREESPRLADGNVEAFWKGYECIRGVDFE